MARPVATVVLRGALVLLLALLPLRYPQAQEAFDVEVGGERIEGTKTSFKCSDGGFEGISTRRLVNCDSAKLLEFTYEDVAKQVAKFTISPSDRQISEGVRAELRDMHEARNGEEIWYRFATLLPEDFAIDSQHRLVLAQWHERMQEGKESLRPPLSHRLWDGRFVVTLWNNERVAARGREGDGEILFELPRIERGVWYDFVYKVKWSPGADGEIAGWMRQCPILNVDCGGGSAWQRIVDHKGSTGYEDEFIVSYYFKLGLYTVTDFDVPYVAYHKNYRTGERADEVGATDAIFH